MGGLYVENLCSVMKCKLLELRLLPFGLDTI